VFDIGSCSKAFVATELAMLADQQQLAWTDHVSAHLPGFTMYDNWGSGQIQVQELLLHRSGLTPKSNGESCAHPPDYPSPCEVNFHFSCSFPESGPRC